MQSLNNDIILYLTKFLDNLSIWTLRQTCNLFLNKLPKLIFDIYSATKFGYLNLLKYANVNPWKFQLIETASEYNHLNILNWARGYKKSRILIPAAKKGHIDLFKWAWMKDDCCPFPDIFSAAVYSQNLDFLQWLHKIKCPWDYKVTVNLCKLNNYNILKWALTKKCQITPLCLNYAIKNNNLKMIKLLKKHNVDLLTGTYYASKYGNIELLKWMLNNNFPDGGEASVAAIKTNNVQILEYLHSNEYTIMPEICDFAAINCNINVLKWAVDNNFEIDKKEILDYITRNKRITLDDIKWCKNVGASWNDKFIFNIIFLNKLDVLEWAINEKCPCSFEKILEMASFMNKENIVLWILDKKPNITIKLLKNIKNKKIYDLILSKLDIEIHLKSNEDNFDYNSDSEFDSESSYTNDSETSDEEYYNDFNSESSD